jgi:hypothetical protein
MKHFTKISSKPGQAMSVVEFDGAVAVYGRALKALSDTVTFMLSIFGWKIQSQHLKETGKP